jgi:hypothetical protein
MSFKRTYLEAKAAHKPMKRSKLTSKGKLKRGTKRLGPGKKTKQWTTARAIIKQRFEKVGITTCELQRSKEVKHDCGIDNYLGFAHDAKRRKLTADDLYRVILICNFAHDIIEVWPPKKMKAIVNETIEKREVQP